MTQSVKPIPDGYEGISPYLYCRNAEAAIEFYTNAFGATELYRIGAPGMIGHAELKLGNTIFMLADEHPEMGAVGPETIGGSPLTLMFYVDDVDAFVENAVSHGLEIVRPVEDQFYGDRSGHFKDPFGHQWCFATHKEDLTPEEIGARAAAAYGG